MYVIGITGLSCSGKTTLSKKLQASLGDDICLLISMDDYYKELSENQYEILHNDNAEINFDTPERINFELLKSNLYEIKSNSKEVKLPKFDLSSCVITSWQTVEPNKIKYIILEGLFIFNDIDISNFCNLKIWIETSEYVCALRRFIKFTTSFKGYSHEYVYNQCLKYVIPGQDKYIKPMKKICDFFINGEKDDISYVEMIVKYIT